MRTERLSATEAGIGRAAALLREGATVAFPTETVYGLGANALDPAAVASVFEAKNRPAWDPLIVHVAEIADVSAIAIVSTLARRLMEAFWPGALTLLLPRTRAVPDGVTAARALVGVRVPANTIALELLRRAEVPVAAPSANRFGHTSPTTAQHVLDDLDSRIGAVLDGGATTIGLESSVFDPATRTLYRPGAVTAAMLETITGSGTVRVHVPAPGVAAESTPSPGTGLRHYAPRAKLVLIESLSELPTTVGGEGAVLLPTDWPVPPGFGIYAWGAWKDHATLARNLFAGLRALDEEGVATIFCPVPKGPGVAAAIRDRLERAAYR